jgi:alpha-N-acetylglucosamine transferase
MSKGYVMMASGKEYVKQAYLCALSIKKTQEINSVSIITNDELPDEYHSVFDNVIEIPWQTGTDFYRTEDRWKIFHVTPYTETIVLDTDMIFLSNIDYVWIYLEKYDVCFTTNVQTYKGTTVKDSYYRQAFAKNNLPNIYCAFHYFKKNDIGLQYYKQLELICKNHEEFYDIYLKKLKPRLSSMDINHAIAVLNTDLEKYSCNLLSFVHMKSKVQDWTAPNDNWLDDIPYYMDDDCNLKIGNYSQLGVFHYTEDKFCNQIMEKYNVR